MDNFSAQGGLHLFFPVSYSFKNSSRIVELLISIQVIFYIVFVDVEGGGMCYRVMDAVEFSVKVI